MALMYEYEFLHLGKPVYFYAPSEVEARAQFEETYGVMAGEHVVRRPF